MFFRFEAGLNLVQRVLRRFAILLDMTVFRCGILCSPLIYALFSLGAMMLGYMPHSQIMGRTSADFQLSEWFDE